MVKRSWAEANLNDLSSNENVDGKVVAPDGYPAVGTEKLMGEPSPAAGASIEVKTTEVATEAGAEVASEEEAIDNAFWGY